MYLIAPAILLQCEESWNETVLVWNIGHQYLHLGHRRAQAIFNYFVVESDEKRIQTIDIEAVRDASTVGFHRAIWNNYLVSHSSSL